MRSRRHTGLVIVLAGAIAVAGCSNNDSAGNSPTTTSATVTTAGAPAARPMDPADVATLTTGLGDPSCEELDQTHCLLPFPSDRFTVADNDSASGRSVALPTGQLANAAGTTLDVTEWNRNDGFSPGSPMLVSAAGVDLQASKTPTIGDIATSMEATSPSLVIDLDTGDRIPHWVELDLNAPEGQRLLIVRPAVSLPEGHHIGVALGELVDTNGAPLVANLAFRSYRDGLTTTIDRIEDRRDSMEQLLVAVTAEGFDRSTLFAAWDFTVASTDNLSGRLLTMRDLAFDRLGDAAPTFAVTEVVTTDLPPGIARRVRGTFGVPSFLSGAGEPGSRLTGATDDEPPSYAGYDYQAGFTCQLPAQALAVGGPGARPVVYGHGLLGGKGEAENSQVAKIASTNNMAYCATDWIGMSAGDLGNAVAILTDLSLFPSLPDRSQQGILNTLFLARLMKSSTGFAADPAFANAGGASALDTTEVYYDGNSQGGIMGGAATAVATDWTKAVLGVTGMNYALLLSRSVDFSDYFQVLRGAYPDPVEQAIIYPLLSMLWDRGEANGYAQHMTSEPYEGTPEHQVLLHVGVGDHQVAQVAAEIEARTIGAVVRSPALADGRHPDARPFYGLDVTDEIPDGASALVYWDSGTLLPPPGNVTPTSTEEFAAACGTLDENALKSDLRCADSHEDPRRAPESILQKDLFFRPDGRIEDTCDAKPCTAVHRSLLDY